MIWHILLWLIQPTVLICWFGLAIIVALICSRVGRGLADAPAPPEHEIELH